MKNLIYLFIVTMSLNALAQATDSAAVGEVAPAEDKTKYSAGDVLAVGNRDTQNSTWAKQLKIKATHEALSVGGFKDRLMSQKNWTRYTHCDGFPLYAKEAGVEPSKIAQYGRPMEKRFNSRTVQDFIKTDGAWKQTGDTNGYRPEAGANSGEFRIAIEGKWDDKNPQQKDPALLATIVSVAETDEDGIEFLGEKICNNGTKWSRILFLPTKK